VPCSNQLSYPANGVRVFGRDRKQHQVQSRCDIAQTHRRKTDVLNVARCSGNTKLAKLSPTQNITRSSTDQSEMGKHVTVVLYALAMAAIIVGVDLAFFRNRFWERLTVNIGIVLVFGAFYLRFLKHPS
jgi:hypothetical protein